MPILKTIICDRVFEQSREQRLATCMALLREMITAISGLILPRRLVDALECVEQPCAAFSDKVWATECLRVIRRALVGHERATAALENH